MPNQKDILYGPLSSRLRPDVECAPWVIEEVRKLEAALAQNAQGEAVADGPSDSDVERACHRYYNAGFAVALPRPEAMRAALTTYHKRLHAERARVPDQVVALISKWREPAAGTEGRESDPYMAGYNDACDHLASELESSLAAAPSAPEGDGGEG